MKNPLIVSVLAASVLFSGSIASAQEKKAEAESKAKSERGGRAIITVNRTAGEKENVTYLGVETAPVPRALAAHLGLAPDMGLTVVAVAENSPASGVLQQHDVLKKFEDQLLVDSRQLSVLIRARKAGDEIKLTIVRGGREMTVNAKLGEREISTAWGGRSFDLGDNQAFRFFDGEGGLTLERLRELPGIARDEVNEVIRRIGRERGNWFSGPGVHVFRRPGAGEHGQTTIFNLSQGNFSFSDDKGSVEVNASDGKRQLTVKDAAGKVLFEGPINTDEDRQKLPAEIKERLDQIGRIYIDEMPGEDFEQEAATVAPKPKSTSDRSRGAVPPPSRTARPF